MIHQLFEERIRKELKALGYKVQTGAVGILKQVLGPTIMFRAAMDRYAVTDVTSLLYASGDRMKRTNAADAPVIPPSTSSGSPVA